MFGTVKFVMPVYNSTEKGNTNQHIEDKLLFWLRYYTENALFRRTVETCI
jgi:hypothetical protein